MMVENETISVDNFAFSGEIYIDIEAAVWNAIEYEIILEVHMAKLVSNNTRLTMKYFCCFN